MSFILLFREETAGAWLRLLLLAIISGGSNAAVLTLVNHAISHMDNSETQAATLAAFLATIVCFAWSQRYLLLGAAEVAQRAIHGIRARFADKLQSIELRDMEHLNRAEIYTCLNAELQTISEAAISLTILGQSALVLVAAFAYLAWLSPAAFLSGLGFVAIAAIVNLRQTKRINEAHQTAFAAEARLLTAYTDLIEGFKELKLNAAKARDVTATIARTSHEIARKRLTLNALFAGNVVTSETLFFALVAVIVFGIPTATRADTTTVAMTATSVLFLLGPISGVVSGAPMLQRMNAAATTLLLVEERLSRLSRTHDDTGVVRSEFQSISLCRVTFRYLGEDQNFVVGPIDLDIKRGDVLFITGGNGSGKSTLLKVLTGLYPPSSSSLQIDGQVVTRDAAYRSLFSAIFSDNHLFKELYGLLEPDPEEAAELFRLTEMETKTRISNRAFETIDLSGGQRKRLGVDCVAARAPPYLRARRMGRRSRPAVQTKILPRNPPVFEEDRQDGDRGNP